jgi:hypothetical protein
MLTPNFTSKTGQQYILVNQLDGTYRIFNSNLRDISCEAVETDMVYIVIADYEIGLNENIFC